MNEQNQKAELTVVVSGAPITLEVNLGSQQKPTD